MSSIDRRTRLVNADKVDRWNLDVRASVDMYNQWFLESAPRAYIDSRIGAIGSVKHAFTHTSNLKNITPNALKSSPVVLSVLRMCTAPPLARDRLVGLARATKGLVGSLENGHLPSRMSILQLDDNLGKICTTILPLIDKGIFPWFEEEREPENDELEMAATVVADRLTGAIADPVIRNAQERRQLDKMSAYLEQKGYRRLNPTAKTDPRDIEPGTFALRYNVKASHESGTVNIPIDVIVQPILARSHAMPLLVECKSAGDFTNTNKRRKEEATKVHQLKRAFGEDTQFFLFLGGYFDAGYLGYEAAEGLDWIWEHRIEDFAELGL